MTEDRPKRKRSWRELDRARDRGGSAGKPRKTQADVSQDRSYKSQAYKSYKANLDKLFTPGSGGELPESLKAKLGGSPGPESSDRQARTKALHEMADAAALGAYLEAGFDLPEDPRLLMRLLDVQDEVLVVPVLGQLLQLVESGKKPNRMLLIQKLEAMKLRLGDGDALDLALQLRAALD